MPTVDISITKFTALDPMLAILSIGITTFNFPVVLFFFFFETPKPIVLPLPVFFVFGPFF